jgi:hypothetical protein
MVEITPHNTIRLWANVGLSSELKATFDTLSIWKGADARSIDNRHISWEFPIPYRYVIEEICNRYDVTFTE